MIALNKETILITTDQDVVLFRNRAQEQSVKIRMSLVNQTKMITAGSELVRNMIRYAGGGRVTIETVTEGIRTGVRMTFEDEGPGIKDVAQAMLDGFSTGRSLGLGLPGAKRLSDEFNIHSIMGKGTKVMVIKWR